MNELRLPRLHRRAAQLEARLAYLRAFLARYGGAKLERARDLFEQALAGAPPAEAPLLFRMYAEA